MAFRAVRDCFTIPDANVVGVFISFKIVVSLQLRGLPVLKFQVMFIGMLCAWGAGCNADPGSGKKVATTSDAAANAEELEAPPRQSEPSADDDDTSSNSAENDAPELPKASRDASSSHDLALEGISFVVPGDWKKVAPQNRIIEAEFELPRVAGDDYDGRLTLMHSGGDPREVIAIRSAEFRREPGDEAKTENLKIGGYEASLLDIRGEWKGTQSQALAAPRPNYRMLLLIIPFGERSGFYAKLTGPRPTIAEHEDAFKKFIHSATISR